MLNSPGFAHFAPVPPLTLLDRQSWVLRLRNRRHENIKAARIQLLPLQPTQFTIHLVRAASAELRHRLNPEQSQIFQHRRSNRDQVFELTCLSLHIFLFAIAAVV
jgi:hypothetical protein